LRLITWIKFDEVGGGFTFTQEQDGGVKFARATSLATYPVFFSHPLPSYPIFVSAYNWL
jgi:hypothetical protein